MNILFKQALVITFLLLVPALQAARAHTVGGPGGAPRPHVPAGIYAVVRVEEVLKHGYGDVPAPTSGVNSYFTTFYNFLLSNQAVSGLSLQVHWDTLNPNPPGDANAYFWDYVQDAFNSVDHWNADNPANQKTIQLIVTPGFNSPQWVRDELVSCDPIFENVVDFFFPGCGKVTFTGYNEGGDSTELPLPWNATYQAAWKTFLQALAAKYNGPNSPLVSIAVAGPTAASAEMILPNDNNKIKPSKNNTPNQTFAQHGGPPKSFSPNDMWTELLQLFYYLGPTCIENFTTPSCQPTDQAFIAAWDRAIDTYGEVFSGLTLVVTTGNGLPDLGGQIPSVITTPIDFMNDCLAVVDMDCQAETTILSYFAEPYPVGGSNAKATQTSGLEAAHEGLGNLGTIGVKFLTQQTEAPSPSALTSQILGGAQFNNPISQYPAEQASPSTTSAEDINQGLYNGLQDFFTGTNVGTKYCQSDVLTPQNSGPAPLNYLEIYYQDIVYAGMHSSEGRTSVNTAGTTVNSACGYLEMTFQGELNTASAQLLGISEP
jgi:hypothetical protein